MDLNIQTLIDKIDKLRNLLYSLITINKQLTDKSVVDCSQQLDMLLTEYEAYKKSSIPSDAA
jgi:hypothetical protein